MASDLGKQIQSVARGDTFGLPPERIHILQEKEDHPLHKWHMARVHPDNPAFQSLLNGMRTLGWPTGSIVFATAEVNGETIKDEETGKTVKLKNCIAATGKRRITAARIVNAEWVAAGMPKSDHLPIVVPITVTKDPILAENIENSYREADPPLVRARRFLTSVDALGSELAAAASNGFISVAEAREAVELLASDPDMQAAVNRKEVPVRLASATTKLGREKAKSILAEATDAKTGRVDPKKVDKAVKATKKTAAKEREAAGKKRMKIMPATKVDEIRKSLKKSDIDKKFVALLDYLMGKKNALDEFPTLREIILGE